MKLSEQLQDLEDDLVYPGTGIDASDRRDLLRKVRETIPLAQAMERCCEALDAALQLLSVPEHLQDEDWALKYRDVVDVHARYEALHSPTPERKA